MITFKATIKKFGAMGEKTGWSYIEVSAAQSNKIKADYKRSYKVKGKLDKVAVAGLAMIPMGKGAFIIPLKTDLRKKLGKEKGAQLAVQLEEDTKQYQLDKELVLCLEEEPLAHEKFFKLPMSHRNYYSKWIESAKTTNTKVKRIGLVLNAMINDWTYPEMLRHAREQREIK
jgi:hypothetical protein